eukprot:TRINITY_DN1539_c0_g1_i1.p1 TRINITY_DN1539_c0_g1~~TRINITY_DN1539_c0_g1_i1.p1  ORF type:complete len:392 (-),score=61.29 TRINITY_DN1539_c0_g1_i1:78-1253(-)
MTCTTPRKYSDSFTSDNHENDLDAVLLDTLKKLTSFHVSDIQILENSFAEGSYSTLKRARMNEAGQWIDVAIKRVRILPEEDEERRCVAAVLREVLAYSKLCDCGYFHQSPKPITKFHGFCWKEPQELGREVDIVLELAAGISLHDMILDDQKRNEENKLLTADMVSKIARELLFAVKDLHDLKMIHRDICPSNVMVDQDSGLARLVDLGTCKIVDGLPDHAIGTLEFRSPEMVLEKTYSYATDTFSLGLVLCCAASGKTSCPDVIAKDENGDLKVILPSRETPGFERMPSYFFGFVEACLALEPEKRWSMEELLSHPFVTFVDVEKRDSVYSQASSLARSSVLSTTRNSSSLSVGSVTEMNLQALLPREDSFTDDITRPRSSFNPPASTV